MSAIPTQTNPYGGAGRIPNQGVDPAAVGQFNGGPVAQVESDDKARNGRETKHQDAQAQAQAQDQAVVSTTLRKRKAQELPTNPDAMPAGGKDAKHVGGGPTPGLQGESELPADASAHGSSAPAQDPAHTALRQRCEALCDQAEVLLVRERTAGALPNLSKWERCVAQHAAAISYTAIDLRRAGLSADVYQRLRSELDRAFTRLADAVAAAGIGNFAQEDLEEAVFMPFLVEHLRSGERNQVVEDSWILMCRLSRGPLPADMRDRLLYCLAQQVRASFPPASSQPLRASFSMRIQALVGEFTRDSDPRVMAQAVIAQAMRHVDAPAVAQRYSAVQGCLQLVGVAVLGLIGRDPSDDAVSHVLRCALPVHIELPARDARRWFTGIELAELSMMVTLGLRQGLTMPTRRCELLVNHTLAQADRAGFPLEWTRQMMRGVASGLSNPTLSDASRSLLTRLVAGTPELAARTRGWLIRDIAFVDRLPPTEAITSAVVGQIVDTARGLPPRLVGRLVQGLIAMDVQSHRPTGLHPLLVLSMLCSGEAMTPGQMTMLACSYAIAQNIRQGNKATRDGMVREFEPFVTTGTQLSMQQRYGGIGVRMACRPSSVLSEAGLEPQEQLALLTYVYQIPGVLDVDAAQTEFGHLISADVGPQRRMDLLSPLFQHGGQYLGMPAMRSARELMIGDALRLRQVHSSSPATQTSADAWSALAGPPQARSWEAVADEYALVTPLVGLHNALLQAQGLNFVYEAQPDPATILAHRPALERYRDFMEAEIADVNASGLSKDMKHAVCTAMRTRLAPVLAALATQSPSSSSSSTSLSTTSKGAGGASAKAEQ